MRNYKENEEDIRNAKNRSSQPILTIALPTYNRASYLHDNLDILLPQISQYSGSIEVLINDNASNDNTAFVVSQMEEKYKIDIDYHCESKNIGGEKSIEKLAAKAMGKYLFILGDDDLLSPNFISIVIPFLHSDHNYALIHFNRISGDSDCSNGSIHDNKYEGMIKIFPYDIFWKKMVSSPNFLSSIIIRTDCFQRANSIVNNNYYGYEWFAKFCFGSIGETCLYYYMPIVIQRNPTRSWASLFPLYTFVGLTSIFKDLDIIIPGVLKEWKNRFTRSNYYNYYGILSSVIDNPNVYKQHKEEMLMCIENDFDRFLFIILIYVKPKMLARLIYKFCVFFLTIRMQ